MIWFTADTHFWHKRVIEYCERPWSSVEAMNEGLIDRWNEVVKPDDTVYVLGDFAFCGTTEIKRISSRLIGKKHIVLGNHDWKYPRRRWLEFGFYSAELSHQNALFSMSHFPYKGSGDHTAENRFELNRLEDDGKWLLHGHIHRLWRIKGKMLNVGVDRNNYYPISIDEILREIAGLR